MSDIEVKVVRKTAPKPWLEKYGVATVLVTVPSFVWTQLLTHKRLARNAASNRALSTDNSIGLGHYTPESFKGKGQGMMAGDELPPEVQMSAKAVWEAVWQYTSEAARILDTLGVSKEQANRVLPLFKNVTGVLTGTMSAWNALIPLREHNSADSAQKDEFIPLLKRELFAAPYVYSYRHTPFIEEGDPEDWDALCHVLGARIARASYGKPGQSGDDVRLSKRLLAESHLSPFEHPAKWEVFPSPSALHTIWDKFGAIGLTSGWQNYRADVEEKCIPLV